MHNLSRAVLVLILLLAPVSRPGAALPRSDAPDTSLVGQLLVAAPDMPDPHFTHAVVLIVQHDRGGTLGIVINRPVGEEPMAKLLGSVGQDQQGVSGSVEVFSGGPVEPWIGFVVHSAEYHQPQTVGIDGNVAMTSSADVLRDIAHHAGPHKSLIAFGYTGWGPGQLEGEIARHGWFTIPEDPKLVFDEDRAKVWDDARARQTFPL